MSADKPKKPTVSVSQARRQAFRHIREELGACRPTLEDALSSGEYEGPYRMGDYWETAKAIVRLRQAREAAGLSQRELAQRTGIDATAISRVESGRQPNVTLRTLQRLANGVGRWFLLDLTPPDTPTSSASESEMEHLKAAARHGRPISEPEAAEIARFAARLAGRDRQRREHNGNTGEEA